MTYFFFLFIENKRLKVTKRNEIFVSFLITIYGEMNKNIQDWQHCLHFPNLVIFYNPDASPVIDALLTELKSSIQVSVSCFLFFSFLFFLFFLFFIGKENAEKKKRSKDPGRRNLGEVVSEQPPTVVEI